MATDAPRRTPLTRERALAAAVALADAEGIDAVSMRNLAARLGVVPMALYKHVSGKDDLLGGMVDALIATYDPADPALPWKAAVRERILSARRVLLEHRWARPVIESRGTRTPHVLGYMNSLAGLFIGGGLSPDLTHHAMHVLGHRIWGFSPEAFDDARAATGPAAPGDPATPAHPAEALDQLQQVYPHIAAIVLSATGGDPSRLGAGCDEQFEFEFALDLILDAVERLHRAGWRSA